MTTLSKESEALLVLFARGYRVSDAGEVYRLDGVSVSVRKVNGYLAIGTRIRSMGFNSSVPVHRLMGYQKYGDKIFDSELELRHVNSNSYDNSKDNIVLGTHQQNMLDIAPKARVEKARKAAQRKLSNEELQNFRVDRASGLSYKQLMQKYGLSKSTISYIVNQKTYSWM